MSGFLKRKTDTVNPAGGVNPAQEPNVGQYGWTSYDAANVNQIIEYVNMAREAATSAKDSADYVASKFGELQAFIDYIDIIYTQIGPIFDNIEVIYKDIVQKHKEVTSMHGDVKTSLAQVLQSATDAHNSAMESHGEAVKSELSADKAAASSVASANSATKANASAKDAADIAEELRKGQVYRGTWNIEANASFPPKPDTNSIWDVTLNESSVSYVFAGETWYWGDRLLYLKDDDRFSQIESGSGVISVNGKSGAVTLIASDVGAVALDGSGVMTGDLQTPKISLLNPETGIYNSEGEIVVQSTKAFGSNLFGSDKKNTYLVHKDTLFARKGSSDYKIYHEGLKPTAADVGALSLSGGTVRGQTIIEHGSGFQVRDGGDYGIRMVNSGTTLYHQAGKMDRDVNDQKLAVTGWYGTPLSFFRVAMAEGKHAYIQQGGTDYRIYHQGYKPTAADVGATTGAEVDAKLAAYVPISGNTQMKGQLTLEPGTASALIVPDKASIRYVDGSGTWFHNYAAGPNLMAWSHGGTGEFRMMGLKSNGELSTEGAQYARIGQVAQSKNDATSISMEAPEDTAPYIASKTPAETKANVALRFGQTELSSTKRIAAGQFRVQEDAGLKFAPTNDLSGIVWGMGVEASSRNLGIHRYNNGVWEAAPVQFPPSGGVQFSNNVYTTGAFISTGGYTRLERSANPMIELHSPGNYAGAIYLPGAGRMRFSQSNGAGGEVSMYAEFQTGAAHFSTCVRPAIKDASWGSWGDTVGGIQDNTGSRIINPGTWHPMVTSASYVDPVQGYAGRWSMGYYRPAAQHNGEVVINLNGDGFIRNNLRLVMSGAASGRLYMDGTETGATWSIQEGGQLYGSIFSHYGHMVNWCVGSFAPISDGNLKKNIKPATKSALDDVAQIEFKSYEWKGEAKVANMEPTKIGLVAQEMEAIDPSYTRDIQTFKPDGSVDTSVKGLDVTNMLALALKAIQEQQVQINELKEKLNEFILK